MNNVCISKFSRRDICQMTFDIWKRKKKKKTELYLYLTMDRSYDLQIEDQRFYHLSHGSIVVYIKLLLPRTIASSCFDDVKSA